MINWKTVAAWEGVNAEAGNTDCVLCVGSGYFAYYARDDESREIGAICDCPAGATMPIALRRFLVNQGYADTMLEIA